MKKYIFSCALVAFIFAVTDTNATLVPRDESVFFLSERDMQEANGYDWIENYEGDENKGKGQLVPSDAWAQISTAKEFMSILNCRNSAKLFLDNAFAKIREMIKGKNAKLEENSLEINALRIACEAASKGDFSKITKSMFSIRDNLTFTPILWILSLEMALKGNGNLLIYYIKTVTGEGGEQLNKFLDTRFHSLVPVLKKRPELIEPVKNALKTNRNYCKFLISYNSGYIGIIPFELAIMTYNPQIIQLFLEIAPSVKNYSDKYEYLL